MSAKTYTELIMIGTVAAASLICLAQGWFVSGILLLIFLVAIVAG